MQMPVARVVPMSLPIQELVLSKEPTKKATGGYISGTKMTTVERAQNVCWKAVGMLPSHCRELTEYRLISILVKWHSCFDR